MEKNTKVMHLSDLCSCLVTVIAFPENDHISILGVLSKNGDLYVVENDEEIWSFRPSEVRNIVREGDDIAIVLQTLPGPGLLLRGERIIEKIFAGIDYILYHPVTEQLLYNPRLQLAFWRLSLMLVIFLCLVFGWLEIAIIILFSMEVGRWGN